MIRLLRYRAQRSLAHTSARMEPRFSVMQLTSNSLRSRPAATMKSLWFGQRELHRASSSVPHSRATGVSLSVVQTSALAGMAVFAAAASLALNYRNDDITVSIQTTYGTSSVRSPSLPTLSQHLPILGNRWRTQCESSEGTQTHGSDDEVDPYDNLPDEDEETHCSMCNTFRKGPCRPFWRKLERCFKDHESEESGAVKCMEYFSPHQTCLQKYLNLYQLVSLDMKQQLVIDTEHAVRDDERRDWTIPNIDWGMWREFVKDQGRDFRQTVRWRMDGSDTTSPLLPLWQRLPEDTEPVLLTVSSKVPQRQDEMILKIAFAVDQDGFVVGLSYNPAYQALLDEANQKAEPSGSTDETAPPPTDEEDTSGKLKGPAPSSPSGTEDDFVLEFFLLPGETRSVRVSALYSESPVGVSPEKELLDVLLCTSPLCPVPDAEEMQS